MKPPFLFDQYNRPLVRADSWYNSSTGYGGADDSIKNTSYIPDIPLSQMELTALYNNWLFRKGVDIPIDDRLGDGIEFLTNDDDTESRRKKVEELTIQFEELGIIDSQIEASKWEGVYGGGLMYFEYGDDPRYELKESQRGEPSKIWVVDRWRAVPASWYYDFIHGPDHPKIGEVETYSLTLQTTGYSSLKTVHESRTIKFGGLPLPPREQAANLMWGQSIIQVVYDICKYFGIGLKAMADTLEDFNWKTLQIENLPKILASNDEDVSRKLIEITALAAKNYTNQSIGIHGDGTELKKHNTTVTGLPDIVELNSNFVAAAFGIPDSRYFSAKGGALAGSSTQSDERHYFKRLRRERKRIDSPRIRRALWMLGYDPAEFPFRFPPLENPTEKEQLETDKLQTEIDEIKINSGVMTAEEVAISRHSKPEPANRQYIIDFEAREKMTDDEEDEPDESIRDSEEDENESDGRADGEDSKAVFKIALRDKKEGAA